MEALDPRIFVSAACAEAAKDGNQMVAGEIGERPLSELGSQHQLIGLPVASTPTNHGVRRGKLERHAIYLGKRFRLMPPQDHQVR